jgi:hypothetical protein
MLDLPEVQRLHQTATICAELRDNAADCAAALVVLRTTTDSELIARWAPLISETIEQLQVAAAHLTTAATVLRNKDEWTENRPLAHILADVCRALAALTLRLECAKAEDIARGLCVRIRRGALDALPDHQRRAIRQGAPRHASLTTGIPNA